MPRRFALLLAALAIAAAPLHGQTPSAESPIPEDIPVGNAAHDETTSRAVMQILRECARSYETADTFRAEGTYIEAAKATTSDKAVTEENSSRIEIRYRSPDKLRVDVAGAEIAAGLIADGGTVTQLWPNEKEYRRMPQPPDLAAFSEDQRAGELIEDDTNALVYSVTAALLISDDALNWLHANVKTYIYDGVEEVRGRPAWRIKFLQTDPEIVVINWIDKETRFIAKVSIIQARDDDGDFVESYADSAYGRIRIAVLDKIETGPRTIGKDAFEFKVPKGWKVRKTEAPEKPSAASELSGWERLVKAAAAAQSEKTTPSLSAQTGEGDLRLADWIERPDRVTALAAAASAGSEGTTFILAASAGKIDFLNARDEVTRSVNVTGTPDFLALLRTAESTGPLVAAAGIYGDTVRTYDFQGNAQWSYERPGSRISGIAAARAPDGKPDSLFVGYLGDTGFRKLGTDGTVRFASRRLTGITSLAAGDLAGAGPRLAVSTGRGGAIFSLEGEKLSKMTEESGAVQVGLLAVEDSNPSAPLVQAAGVGEGEYVVRRVRLDGSPVWTAPLAQGVEEAEPVGLTVARLRLPGGGGQAKPYVAAMLSDGRLTLASAEGEIAWRGRLSFGEALSGDLERVATSLLAADRDGDGEDELYAGGDGGILRIETAARQ